MKKNYLRAVLSFAVAGMMALSMFTAGTSTVKAEDATVTWTTSKSKTVSSTTLDDNNQVKVTLSLPAKQEKLVSDVVFVMDTSSCKKATVDKVKELFTKISDQIIASNASVNIGLVLFKGNAVTAVELNDFNVAKTNMIDILSSISDYVDARKRLEEKDDATAAADQEIVDNSPCNKVKSLEKDLYMHGTNMPSGLACAKDMLDGDVDVASTRKHMILVSDGATYLFCKNNSKTGKLDYLNHSTRMTDKGTVGTLSEWEIKHGSTDGFNWDPSTIGKSWDKYLQDAEDNDIREKLSENYDQDYYITDSERIMPLNDSSYENYDAVLNIEKSFYQAHDLYKGMTDEGYDCHSYLSGDVVGTLFTGFMNYLAGGEAQSFTQISNDIFYLLSAGSVVTDEMGNMSNQYEFNFVNDAANLVLTVGNDQYIATKATTLPEGVTAMYLFNSANASYDTKKYTAPFILEYYDGSNGGAERIEWYINTNVSEFAPVQLTYTEQMTNYQTTAGTYTAYTNNDAMLYPIDSNDVEGVAETFERPSITFTVRTATPKGPDQPSATTDPVPTTAPADRPTTPTADDRNERPNTPNTGDQTNAPLAAGVLAVALLTCGAVFFFKKKYSN